MVGCRSALCPGYGGPVAGFGIVKRRDSVQIFSLFGPVLDVFFGKEEEERGSSSSFKGFVWLNIILLSAMR
jgi:hypothetical protein